MNYRTLGRTGLQVSELALGGLFVSSHGAEFEDARLAVHRAVELGINYIDTAPTYANSEEVLGRILPEIEKPVILSTKLGGRPNPFEPQNPDHLRQSVKESLRLLGRDSIDILMVHEPDRPGQYGWWSDIDAVEGPVLGVLDELKAEGVIRYTGLGGTTAYEMARLVATGKFDVLLTAFNYNLIWREAEYAILPEAKKQNMGVVIGSPLQQGALAKRYDEVESGGRWMSPPRRAQFKELYRFLDEIDIPLPELALRFILSNGDISCTLTGSRSREEVELNVRAAEAGPLPADILKRLNEIAALVPFRPSEEPVIVPFGRGYGGPGYVTM